MIHRFAHLVECKWMPRFFIEYLSNENLNRFAVITVNDRGSMNLKLNKFPRHSFPIQNNNFDKCLNLK